VVDTTAPLITASGTTLNAGCNPTAAQINAALGTASATDNCGTPVVSNSDGTVIINECNRTQTRTFTATDDCGNVSSTSRTITWVVDTIAPVIIAEGISLDLGCNPSVTAIGQALGNATATDECRFKELHFTDQPVIISGCNYSQTRIFTASDSCGNISQTSRTARWMVDTLSPVITAYGSTINAGCNPTPQEIDAALGTASATDNCGNPIISYVDGDVMINGCIRTQTRTFTAIDACNNTGTTSRTITWVEDTITAVITATGTALELGCNPSFQQIEAALGTATATDNCGTPSIHYMDGNIISNGCLRIQKRTFTATDECGNISTASREARWFFDTSAPELTVSGTTLNAGCNPTPQAIEAALGIASATDACGSATITYIDSPVTENGCRRIQTRVFRATDPCGNETIARRTIEWRVDTIAPKIQISDTLILLNCNPTEYEITNALGTVSATDNCGIQSISHTDISLPEGATRKSRARQFYATDSCGNRSYAVRTVSWVADTIAPFINGPLLIELSCNEPVPSPDTGLFEVTDNHGVIKSFTYVSDSTFTQQCTEFTQRSYRAIDSCGNARVFKQVIKRRLDQEPPVIHILKPLIQITCPDQPKFEEPRIEDDCGVLSVRFIDSIIPGPCSGSYTALRIWEAVDSCGNKTTERQAIKVICYDTLKIDSSVCINRYPIQIHGKTYSIAGNYKDTLEGDSMHCDTIVIIRLSSLPLQRSDTAVSVCRNDLPYVWRDRTYNIPGSYSDTSIGIDNDCDTIFHLDLFLFELNADTTKASVCTHDLPYKWNGNNIYASGIFRDTLTSYSNGCDTAAVLILSVLPYVPDTQYITTSELRLPYIWNGNSYSEEGTYQDTLISKDSGCDTAAVLVLKIVPYLTSNTRMEICEVELPYTWHGKVITEAGTYSALLKNDNGIDSLVVLQLSVIPEPVIIITDPDPICAPGYIDLTAESITKGSDTDLVFTYWQDAALTIPLLRPDSVTVSNTYYIKASRQSKCRPAPPYEVTVTIYPIIPGQRYAVKYAKPNSSLLLRARNLGMKYLWQPSDGLNDSTIRDPIFNYAQDMEYLIRITTPEGCSFTDTAVVRIVYDAPAMSESSIHMPNAWSPNMDGHNDILRPIPVNIRELRYFRVFNRWGQLVYQTTALGEGWDGRVNGALQPIDAYTWTLEAIGYDNKFHKKAGNALLIK
jgi:gliding motility-associated-like protein